MVDVCMITYNHESFIAQAIEGFLIQKTNFQTRLIIGEDGSKDNTRAICIEYQSKYPERIILLPDEGNLGMNINFMRTLKACTAKYVAICEGDDYWTDSLKLQKQVDFLEQNTKYVACFGNTQYLCDNPELNGKNQSSNPSRSYIQSDIVKENHVFTLTVLFRNSNLKFAPKFAKLKIGDWPLWVMVLNEGDMYYFDEVWGKYRVHAGGVYSGISLKKRYLNLIDAQMYINEITHQKYNESIKECLMSLFIQFNKNELSKPIEKIILAVRLCKVCGLLPFWYFIEKRIPKNKFYFLCVALSNKTKRIF